MLSGCTVLPGPQESTFSSLTGAASATAITPAPLRTESSPPHLHPLGERKLSTLDTIPPFTAQTLDDIFLAALRPPFPSFENAAYPPFAGSYTDETVYEDPAKPSRIEPITERDDLWQVTREHFRIRYDLERPRIKSQLSWYARHPHYIDRVTERAERYYYYILNEVIKRDMPAEMALLPIVESAFDPFAYSHGRAAGPWQFIPGTARHFGLQRSWWYDGRRDIVASTDAALTYLQQLHRRFDGDWLLALAAYNAGGGNVSKAIRKNTRRQRPTDFWSLDLPSETEAYVPKLLALAALFNEPQAHGITLKPLANTPYFEAVETESQIDLAQAAKMADISIDELYLLNPGFNQWATDPAGPHQLLVPIENAETFRAALANLPPEKRISWSRYKVNSGDNLISIAKKNNTTVATLRTTNNLQGNVIRAGQMLLIPTASKEATLYSYSAKQRQRKKNQRIALRSGKQKVQYQVQRGDSFWKISRQYGVSTRALASWNQMAPGDPLKVGKHLVIWQNAASSNSSTAPIRNKVRKIGYRVRNGDSFARIASRFNVRINDIQRWNNQAAQAKYLKPGQTLTLYVDVTKAR